MAVRWRGSGVESWPVWLAGALVPGIALRWVEIVRRTAWPALRIAAGALMTSIAAWGYTRIGGTVIAAAALAFALYTLWLFRRRITRRRTADR